MVCLKLKGNTNQYNLTLPFSGVSQNIKYIKDNTLYTVNTEIFVRILCLRITFKRHIWDNKNSPLVHDLSTSENGRVISLF